MPMIIYSVHIRNFHSVNKLDICERNDQTSITAQLFRVIEFELSMERHYIFNHQAVTSC